MSEDLGSNEGAAQKAEWYFPPKKNGRWKVWLIAGLSAAALAIVAIFLIFILPGGPAPEPTPTQTPSSSPTSSPSPTESPSATTAPEPTTAPTEPPIPDPDLGTFTNRVQPWLDDAETGLQFASESSGTESAEIVDQLQQDAERLSDTAAPSSIAAEWSSAVASYMDALEKLRGAYADGSGVSAAESSASSALQDLRALAGL